jgi:hypothetical protein
MNDEDGIASPRREGEFRRRLSARFWGSVLAMPKIFLIGDEHGLADLAL